MTQAAHKPTPAARTAAHSDKAAGHGRRTQVRDSGIHGKGVYAVRPIQAGERVLEYKGEIITWEEALEDHGFDVLQAGDASEALGLCASRPRRPDLFLLDIALPGPSGIELLETLRRRDDMRMLFKLAKDATPDDVRRAVKIIEALHND